MTDQNIAAIQPKPPIVVMRERLEARTEELKSALMDIRPEQFIRAVITSATINPELQACSWQSLWLACMRACRDDLLPDGRQGAIVPFKDKATWIPMYQGLLLRAWRTGRFKWIGANIVRVGDGWSHYIDETGEHFRHDPSTSISEAPLPMISVYAAATTLDGGMFLAVLPKAEADKIRATSKTRRDDSPWITWEGEMYKKTALRRLAKMLPVELSFADEEEAYEPPAAVAKLPSSEPRRAAGAIAALDAFAGKDGDWQPGELADDSPPAGHAAPESPEQLLKRQAYLRGKADKSAGVARKAVPVEFRDDNKLALAWALGWSGEQFPTRSSDEPESK